MFLDEKSIEVRSGKGGDGICSFHREKFVPLGGPDGGDGGRGGHVILQVNEQFSTLLDMGNARLYKAQSGQPGGAKRCTGRSAEDLIVDVPRGTIVKDAEGRILADLTAPGSGDKRHRTSAKRMERFLEDLRQDSRVATGFYECGDGLSVSRIL